MILEHFFACPCCGESISMLLELSIDAQFYVEDCEVCCQPINVIYQASNETLLNFEAQRADA